MLRGKKIILTAIQEKNLKQLRHWRNLPELRKYFREYRILSEKMQENWFKKIQKDTNQYNFEIHVPQGDSSKLIGHCGLYYINWIHRSGEFGIYIGDRTFLSGGYGADALRTLLTYGFNDLNLNRIWCEVYGNNDALGIYRHIGFKDEGVLRQSYFNEGKYWDSYILSMLKTEYEKLPK